MTLPRNPVLAACTLAAVALVAAGCSRGIGDPLPNVAAATKIRAELAKAGGPTGGAAAGPTETWTEEMGRANLTGVVTVQGTVSLEALNASKDAAVCAPGGKQPPNEQFVVDPASGGVRDVLIFVEGIADEWCDATAAPGKSEPVLFDQRACIFLSHVLAVQMSQPLQIKNSDPVNHNANLQPKENRPENFLVSPGDTKPYQPTAEEASPFPVSCSIHPWMSAWIITRRNGYFAVTRPDGKFTIPNLPAGVTLRCKIWQERAKFLKAGSLVGEVGAGTWAGTSLELKLEKGVDQSLKVVIDATKVPK